MEHSIRAEIRKPVNAILGMSDQLLESHLDANQRRCVEESRRAALGLLRMFDSILDVLEVDGGCPRTEIAVGLRVAMVPGWRGASERDRRALRGPMKSLGLEIHDFQTAQDALVSLDVVPFDEKPYSLAVVHWVTGDDGFGIAETIRASHPALPILVLSPAGDGVRDDYARMCDQLGIHATTLAGGLDWLGVVARALEIGRNRARESRERKAA